jgi:ribosomal protein L22
MARVLHPDPNARERWERKKVIQMIKKGGRLTKDQFIKRTEREHLVKSHNMKTSTKKLGMIARQIAGKTIDDAITQMRFSNKKVAQEVLKQLEFARDEAVVMRGMGLGSAANRDPEGPDPESSSSSSSAAPPAPLSIQLKDGKRHTVDDRSKIYIDQAWVGRGPYGQLPDYRARGRVYVMRTPWTSLSVVLKEEVTRVRQHEEREAKRKKKITEKVWVHLPDRPIQTHRQWFSW